MSVDSQRSRIRKRETMRALAENLQGRIMIVAWTLSQSSISISLLLDIVVHEGEHRENLRV
jgi:hypothetical protein